MLEAFLADLEAEDPKTQMDAIVSIGEYGDPRVAVNLTPFLQNEDDEIRYSTAVALGNLRAPNTLDALCNALETEKKPLVSRRICQAIGRIATSGAIECLKGGLKHPEPEVRATSAHELGQIADESVIDALKELYEDEGQASWGTVATAARFAVQSLLGRSTKPPLAPTENRN